ncbi:flagellar basal body rod protein FlgC [Marinicellulosiphila megalodicopiae]|uniref:flagellar basal body rod protein FlgC n=1 Tax=Marinicellulosiphila megalodicopiae TaxID=2724896 RepID=UPI003BAEE70E
MSDFDLLAISRLGMQLEQQRMDLINTNIAMANSSSKVGDGYQAQSVSFIQALDSASTLDQVVSVVNRYNDQKLKYDPNHPLANSEGMIELANVDLATEMVDLLKVSRAYEANVKSYKASLDMAGFALEIGK